MISSVTSSTADVAIQPGPSDTTSDIAFCPIAEFFAASSWDNGVRIEYLLFLPFIAVGACLPNHEWPSESKDFLSA